MVDKVQRVMEDMVPELLDLGKRKVFSREEIREIVRCRRGFEYKIASRTPTLRDFLEYLSYEYELERIRNTRTRLLKLKKRTIGDYSIIRLIHFIFKRALRKFPSDEKLWLQNIDFCLKSGSSKALQRSLISALRHNPTNSVFWLIMSDRELQNGNAKEARSTILLGLRVNKESLILWRGFSQLETNIAYRKYLDSFSSSDFEVKKGFSVKSSSIKSLIPILSHGLKRIKLEHKKEAHVLFILRQYNKLHQVLSEGGDFSKIEGMRELEERLLDSLGQSKRIQPLFPAFGIVLGIIKGGHADILDYFKSEIEQVLSCPDTEFVMVALIFICKLIYNCVNSQNIESFMVNASDTHSEAINYSSIVDFGFQISESIQELEDPPESPSGSHSRQTKSGFLHLNMITWYSKTCLDNLHYRDNLQIKKAVNLLKLDPNLWNCCFLEDHTTEELIQKLSLYPVPGIQNREVWKEKLFSKEQIGRVRDEVISYLSQELNKARLSQFVSDLGENVQGLAVAPESLGLKLTLIEALDSLLMTDQTSLVKNYATETSLIEGSSPGEVPRESCNGSIPQLLLTYKKFIIQHGTSSLSPEQVAFVTKSINRLLDLIETQVENDEDLHQGGGGGGLDFVGFSKSVFWTLYIISVSSKESSGESAQDLLELGRRVISSALNVFPRWLSVNKVPGLLFNLLIVYSVLKSSEKAGSSPPLGLLLDYLNTQETGNEVRFESSPIIQILKESADDESLLQTAGALLDLSDEYEWLFTNDITMMSKTKKDVVSITFMLSCISILYLVFERYLESCLSRAQGCNSKARDLNLLYERNSLTYKLFLMLDHFSTYIADLDNLFSDEFKMNVHVRYLLLVKLTEHFKVKRILLTRPADQLKGYQVPTFSGLLNQLNKTFPHIHNAKLPCGISVATISAMSLEDPQFELCLKKMSSLEESGPENFSGSQSSPLAILHTVMKNILNPCQLLAPTMAYFKKSYL